MIEASTTHVLDSVKTATLSQSHSCSVGGPLSRGWLVAWVKGDPLGLTAAPSAPDSHAAEGSAAPILSSDSWTVV